LAFDLESPGKGAQMAKKARTQKRTRAAKKASAPRGRTAATSGKRAPRRPQAARRRPVARTKRVLAVPAGYRSITPYLVCRGTADAIAFYTKAFGAREAVRMAGPDGRIMHAEIRIGDSMVMLGEENPELGATAPPTVGGTTVNVMLYVPDVDRTFAQATAAGATAEMPPTDMFWGDRYCKVADPFGHRWSIATHIEDVTPKEMSRRMALEFAKQSSPSA
jgi:PhnB protein